MKYTKAQNKAINCVDRNLQIIACAGSGKTQVIAARIIELLRINDVHPRNIIAFTFTDKAAAELKDRIATLVHDAFGSVNGLAEMYVGTIHGWCLEFLQGELFEYLKYSVIDDVQCRLLVQRNSRKSGLKEVDLIAGPSQGQKLSRRGQDVKVFMEAMNVAREDHINTSRVQKEFVTAQDAYSNLLDEHHYLDYSGLLVYAAEALLDKADPARLQAQESIASRLKYLVVDEYQDVNPIQETIVRCLHELGANVCVVGDDDQTIYQWRGSEVKNILNFRNRYDDVESATLAENFRSSSGVVDSARPIAERNNPNRLPKSMVAAGHQKYERGDVLALTFDDPQGEAEWMADRILEMLGIPFVDEPGDSPRGLSWMDCAVLLRTVRKSADPIVEAFRRRGIPFVIGGFGNLFDAPEVQAAAISFKYMVQEAGEADVRQAWKNADLGLNKKDLDKGVEVLNSARQFQKTDRWAAYNIQRTYLDFLEAVGLREEQIPPTRQGAARGEVVYYNLGKFSQVISDFEQIHFQSDPQRKYETFAAWLRYEAPDLYEEGGDAEGFAQPDAVQVMTVHQAKGMEWPVVFVPALQRNRFPSSAGGRGRTKWHILSRDAIPDAERYDGSIEDERRLFYVALTRSKKYLYCSYAPSASKGHYSKPSQFFKDLTESATVLTKEPRRKWPRKLKPRPLRETPNVALSFSELKYFFECPYQFKLRFLYGFNPPLHEALGYGKSIHDALAEVHRRAITGDLVDRSDAERLIDDHLHTPFAYPKLRAQLRAAAIEALDRYLVRHGATLPQTEHSEQQVEIQVSPGITVSGRVDLIKRLDTDEVSIVDFKSTERAQEEDVTRAQLHTYAMGYHELTGADADLIEILNLDEAGENKREVVDPDLIKKTQESIQKAGESLRHNKLPRLKHWGKTCRACDMVSICRKREEKKT